MRADRSCAIRRHALPVSEHRRFPWFHWQFWHLASRRHTLPFQPETRTHGSVGWRVCRASRL